MQAVVAQDSSPSPARPLTAWAEWWLILLVLCTVLLTVVGALLARHHTRVRATLDRRKKYGPIKDAWTEAGRRAEPATVDLDPDEAQGP